MLLRDKIINNLRGDMKISLGQDAVFLIPNTKMGFILGDGVNVEEKIKSFLTQHYSSFHIDSRSVEGYWNKSFDGLFTLFVVSFLGKEKIPFLEDFLESLAHFIEEECIYFGAGKYKWLIYPEKDKKYQL